MFNLDTYDGHDHGDAAGYPAETVRCCEEEPMRLILLLFLPFGLLPIASALAADPGAGQALYATCAVCHGAQAQGNKALGAPRLNHLAPFYLQAQLLKFKRGLRGGDGSTSRAQQMAPMAMTLVDEQAVADISAYIARLDSAPPVASLVGDAVLGGDYFNQFCGACHGPGAEGNEALNSPRLVGSEDWYLMAQLQAFRSGERGKHADDRTGRQMRAMAGLLPNDEALADVVAFINSLSP